MKVQRAVVLNRKQAWSVFSVSNLRIPGFEQPWEEDFGKPDRICHRAGYHILMALWGGAAFNNEFGLPGSDWLLPYLRRESEQP